MATNSFGRSLGVVTMLALITVSAACGGGESNAARDADKPGGSTDTENVPVKTTPTDQAVTKACPASSVPVRDLRYADLPGVDPRLVSVDVYPSATACPAPVVIWVHGGGWRTGDKGNQMTDKVRVWNDAGYTVVSVNYRLTDPASAEPVEYPTHNEDVAAAVSWVHDNIARYGGDPSRIALVGHSAGAQIVASVATDERYLGAHGLPLSTIACAAPLDTEGWDVARVAGTGNPIYVDAFGSDPARWAAASPIRHVAPDKGIPPMFLVERGTPGRRRESQRFADALTTAGVPVTTIDGGTLTHADVNRNIGAVGDTVMTAPLSTFLGSCLGAA